MSVLQFTIEEAYSGNTTIKKYKDGVLIDKDIVSDLALSGYINCLENEGYKQAYNVSAYRIAFEDAKEAERIARDQYIEALAHPLYVKN